MYKRLFTLTIFFVFIFSCVGFSGCGAKHASADTQDIIMEYGNFSYATITDGGFPAVRIVGFSAVARANYPEFLIFPDEIDGKPVRIIGAFDFDDVTYGDGFNVGADDGDGGLDNVKHIKIGGGVKLITGVFMCSNAETIVIADGSANLDIHTNAFAGMTKLQTVIFGNTLRQIHTGAFDEKDGRYLTSLSTLVLGSNMTYLGYIFRYCTALKTLVIPAGFAQMRNDTFRYAGIENLIIEGGANATALNLGANAIFGNPLSGVVIINREISIESYANSNPFWTVFLGTATTPRQNVKINANNSYQSNLAQYQVTLSHYNNLTFSNGQYIENLINADWGYNQQKNTAKNVIKMYEQYEEIMQKNGEIDDYAAEVARLGGEITRLEGEIDGLRDEIGDLETERDGYIDDLEKLQNKHDGLEGELDELQRQYDALDDDHADLKEELKTKIEAKQGEIETLNGQISQKQTEINGLNTHIDEITTHRDELIDERNALKTELDELRIAHDAVINALNAEIERLKNAKPPKPSPVFLIIGIVSLVLGLGALGGGVAMLVISRKKK